MTNNKKLIKQIVYDHLISTRPLVFYVHTYGVNHVSNIHHPHASVVPRLCHLTFAGKSTCSGSETLPWEAHRKAVATIGSKDLVVGEDDLLEPICQQYDWQIGRCGSIAFGSSPRRGKTLSSDPHCLEDASPCRYDFRT